MLIIRRCIPCLSLIFLGSKKAKELCSWLPCPNTPSGNMRSARGFGSSFSWDTVCICVLHCIDYIIYYMLLYIMYHIIYSCPNIPYGNTISTWCLSVSFSRDDVFIDMQIDKHVNISMYECKDVCIMFMYVSMNVFMYVRVKIGVDFVVGVIEFPFVSRSDSCCGVPTDVLN